ncbi:MAG: hypothetical protein K2Q10_12105, partial [Rhodospirillales bacterium]|nr:hypothetical protein [Rhodospirillales bacterium]
GLRGFQFLDDSIERILYWTQGYPVHVLRLAQRAFLHLRQEGWMIANADDVDDVVPSVAEEDSVFQDSLCRHDRLGAVERTVLRELLRCADLNRIMAIVREEKAAALVREEKAAALKEAFTVVESNVQLVDLLGDGDEYKASISRLYDFGTLRRTPEGPQFFSPLLEMWLRTVGQREHLLEDSDGKKSTVKYWSDFLELVEKLSQSFPAEGLASPFARGEAALTTYIKAVAAKLDSTIVNSKETFSDFVTSVQYLITEMLKLKDCHNYRFLNYISHTTRLIRNRFVHSGRPTQAAISAWKNFLEMTGVKADASQMPVNTNDWTLLSTELSATWVAALKSMARRASAARP